MFTLIVVFLYSLVEVVAFKFTHATAKAFFNYHLLHNPEHQNIILNDFHHLIKMHIFLVCHQKSVNKLYLQERKIELFNKNIIIF